jgi:ATP phosphoribosyltransferase
VLRLVLPKGSLEKPTLELFEAADLRVERSSTVDYKASVNDPRIDEVRILRPQEIPSYVAEGPSTSASRAGTGWRRRPATW